MIAFFPSLFLFLFCVSCQQNTGQAGEQSQEPYLKQPFTWSGEILFHSNVDGDNEIYKLSRTGLEKLTDNTWDDMYPAWAPDKSKIVFSANPEGNFNLYTMTPLGTRITQITSQKADDMNPDWFADGRRIVYTQERPKVVNRDFQLYMVDLLSKKIKKVLPDYGQSNALPRISPDQNQIVFTSKRLVGWDVAIYDIPTDVVRFLQEGGKSCRARFSPDGQKLAYVSSTADGKGDIWLMNPDGSQKVRLTEREATYDYFPAWSPDGRFIVFDSSFQHDHNGDWQLCILEVKTRDVLVVFDSPGNDVFPDWR